MSANAAARRQRSVKMSRIGVKKARRSIALALDSAHAPDVGVTHEHLVSVDEANERRAMEREHRGTVNLYRIRQLAARLALGPIAVRESSAGWCGDRHVITLDGGSCLRLKLYWRKYVVVAALCSIIWDDRCGWIVRVRTTSGEIAVLYCFVASYTLPSNGMAA